MSQLQHRQFGLYFDSFLPHSSSYEPANESISILKFPDFRFGPDNTINFKALLKSKQKMPVAGSGHLYDVAGSYLISLRLVDPGPLLWGPLSVLQLEETC